ncbi:MAG: BatA domain-containing protein [Pirellulales bacterium]
MMGFVQTAFLAALAAIAIPLVIHLIFHRQARPVGLGSIRFLRQVLRENARRKRLKRWVLLALRMGCVMLLAIVFARPYLLAEQESGKDHFVAILIDVSASMTLAQGDSRLVDSAVAAAKRIVADCGEGTRIEVAFFDDAVRPLRAPDQQESAQTLADRLQAPATTFAATDHGAAIAWARDLCIQTPHRTKDLYILTDLQRSGLDASEAPRLPADVRVHLEDLGRPLPNNVAVIDTRPPRMPVRPGETVTVSATIHNAGPFPLEDLPATLVLESQRRTHRIREQLDLEPGATATVEFEAPSLEEGLWQGTVAIETNDDLSFDNRRYVAVMAAPRLKVLLVDGDPRDSPLLAETYYLETALRLAGSGEVFAESLFDPTVVAYSAETRLAQIDPFDVAVLANVGPLDPADAALLGEFVRGGKSLIVFTGHNVEAGHSHVWERAGLAAGRIGAARQIDDLPARLNNWDETSPLFAPFSDPQRGDLRRLAFEAYTQIEPFEDSLVLARFAGGHPALLQRRLGNGRILWFTSAADGEWSRWIGSRLYLPLVHQMVAYVSSLADGGPIREVLLDATGAADGQIAPGVYERDGYWQVVNVDPRESETERCGRDEFAKRFGLTLAGNMPSEIGGKEPAPSLGASTELHNDEIWHWFAFAVVGLLLVEGFIANRTLA